MATLLWAAQAALVAMFTAPAAAAGATLYDGPRSRGTTPKLFVVVGADSDDPFVQADDVEDTLAAVARQQWSSEGPGTWRDESGSVLCTVVAWDGGTALAPLRAQVESLTDALEAALIVNRQAAGAIGAGLELAELRVWERRSTQGSAVGAVLDISYQSLLN